jgi:hypothetical protein
MGKKRPLLVFKETMKIADEERLIIFLYSWLNVNHLQFYHFTKDVVDTIRLEFHCDLQEFMTCVESYREKGYLDNVSNGDQFVTEAGFRYAQAMIKKHGPVDIKIDYV